jgi:hypothetical protein
MLGGAGAGMHMLPTEGYPYPLDYDLILSFIYPSDDLPMSGGDGRLARPLAGEDEAKSVESFAARQAQDFLPIWPRLAVVMQSGFSRVKCNAR